MNYQTNQNTGNFYPQQPHPGYQPQPAPQQGGAPWQDPAMQQPYMQQVPMQGGMMPQQDFAPMQQTGPMGFAPQQQPMGYPQQEYQPMQQTGPMGYQPQQEFPAMQQTGGFVPQPAPAEKVNPLQSVMTFIKDNDLMFLAIAAVLALVYALYVTFSYAWLIKLLPHIIITWLSVAGNVAVCVMRKKEFGIVAGAGYIVAALLFLNRFYLLIPSVALCAWDFFGKKNA